MEHSTLKRILFALLGFFLVLPSALIASPTVDGKFEGAAEGYTIGYNVNFQVEGVADPIGGGELWYYQDSNDDLYVAFIQPLSLNDNSYGTNSVGWKPVADSDKSHNFTDLLNSDKAQFQFSDSSSALQLDFTLDYLYSDNGGYLSGIEPGKDSVLTEPDPGDASALIPETASSLSYNWDTYGTSNPGLFGNDADSPATSYTSGDEVDYTNSGGADVDANVAYSVTDPLLSGWVFDNIYEFKVDGALFIESGETFDVSQMEIVLVHDSPNKLGKNKTWPTPGTPITPGVPPGNYPVPEPATMLLFGIGLIGIAGKLRRRRLKK